VGIGKRMVSAYLYIKGSSYLSDPFQNYLFLSLMYTRSSGIHQCLIHYAFLHLNNA
jgi:hypothetical protein